MATFSFPTATDDTRLLLLLFVQVTEYFNLSLLPFKSSTTAAAVVAVVERGKVLIVVYGRNDDDDDGDDNNLIVREQYDGW